MDGIEYVPTGYTFEVQRWWFLQSIRSDYKEQIASSSMTFSGLIKTKWRAGVLHNIRRNDAIYYIQDLQNGGKFIWVATQIFLAWEIV